MLSYCNEPARDNAINAKHKVMSYETLKCESNISPKIMNWGFTIHVQSCMIDRISFLYLCMQMYFLHGHAC